MKNSATQECSTSQQGRPLKESQTMKLRKDSAEMVNPKPILKKSTSAAVNTAQLPTQQPRRSLISISLVLTQLCTIALMCLYTWPVAVLCSHHHHLLCKPAMAVKCTLHM